MTDSSAEARLAIAAIVARDGLQNLPAEDVERLVALYAEMLAEMAQLRAAPVNTEPAVIYHAG